MDDEAMVFIADPINLYSMSLRTDPKLEPEGSLTIYSPGANKEANWLPSPKGKCHLDAAPLLARRRQFLDPRRLLGDPAGEAGVNTRMRGDCIAAHLCA